jgi:hypothetical protein
MKQIKLWNATPANDNAIARPMVSVTTIRDFRGEWVLVVAPFGQVANDTRSAAVVKAPVLS